MSEERLIDEEYNAWTGEHFHRYNIAENYIGDNDVVLDIATGTGYGSFQISRITKGKVIGGDISAETIDSCQKRWNANNLIFQVMDGTQIPFPDYYFDVIISFETIEHTTKYKEMLKEFARKLKQEGVLLISTPNILINSPGGVVINKHHTQEFTYEEFVVLLKAQFPSAKIYGQFYNRYQNRKGLKYKIAFLLEKILLIRGIRKIPLSFRDKIMTLLIGKKLYPRPDDYVLTEDIKEIKMSRTLFAICKTK